MNKKAQITAFIIIGLIILIAVLGIIYFRNSEIIDKPPEEFIPKDIPIEVQGLRDYVENCLDVVATRGLEIAGLHGGYVYTEGNVVVSPLFTESSGIEMFPGSGIIVPYWQYMSTSNRCTDCHFSSLIPRIAPEGRAADANFYASKTSNVITAQLNAYINEHIQDCVNHFERHKEQGWNIVEEGDPLSNVIVGEEYITVNMKYPIRAEKSAINSKIEEYSTTIELDFKEIYRTASRTVELLTNTSFMERFTREIIDVYSLGSNPPIPPTHGGIDFSTGGGRELWIKSQVKEELKTYVSDNIGMLQVVTSMNNIQPILEDSLAQNIITNFNLDIRDPLLQYNDDTDDEQQYDPFFYEFNFDYFQIWDMYLDIAPSAGEVIMPESVLNIWPIPFGINRYDFTYDVSYPILIRITSPFELEGYVFQVVYEVNMRNNRPMSTYYLGGSYSGPQSVDVFCAEEHRTDLTYDIKVVDAVTNDPIEGALVSYSCVTDACYLGDTVLEDGHAMVHSTVPACLGAELQAYKEGYKMARVDLGEVIDVATPQNEEIVVGLYNNHLVEVDVKLKEILPSMNTGDDNLPIWQMGSNAFDLSPKPDCASDTGMFILMLEQDDPSAQAYVRVVSFEDDEIKTPMLDLVPGKYKIDSLMFRERDEDEECDEPLLVIPEDVREYDAGWDSETVTLEAIEFNESLVMGAYSLSADTDTLFEVDEETLYDMSKITFYAAVYDPEDVGTHEALNIMAIGYDEEFLDDYADELMPVLE